MGNVLTEATTMKCGPIAAATPHDGTVTAVPKKLLTVASNKVLVGGSTVTDWSISGCGDTGSNQTQCKGLVSITGTATTLKVEGEPVVLDSINGVTNGVPPGTIGATAGIATLLRAV